MAKPRIVFAPDAGRDLDFLFDWITRDAGEDRAAAVLGRIYGVIETIAEMPGMGRIRHDLAGAPRSFAVYPWLVLYRALPEREGIAILRVIDGRRDLPRHTRR